MDFSIYLSKADTLARHISVAEGFPVPGSLPSRIHNPGDLELGNRGWGELDNKTVYLKADFDAPLNDKTDGASALRREALSMLTGTSHDYSPSMTFEEVSVEYTGGDNPTGWCKTVTEGVGATPGMTLAQWLIEK